MTDFEEYLAFYGIDPFHLFGVAHVRYLTVYNAIKGNPLMPENAQKIRQAVHQLTGVPYVGSFVLIEELNPQFPPTRPKKDPRDHHHS